MKTKSLLFLALAAMICVSAKVYYTKKVVPEKTINGLYKYTGKLNDKIPVFLWFVIKDSVISGEVTYLRSASHTPIKIGGYINNADGMMIYEFTKGGKITVRYNGSFTTSALTGTWYTPGSDKTLKYSLQPKDTVLNGIDLSLKPTLIDGNYDYQYGKNGGVGGIDIKHITGNDYYIKINCVTSPPSNNVAEVERVKVKMTNNTIIYKMPDEECKFRVRVLNKIVVIDYLTNAHCGFGASADIDGVFFKTSNKANFSF